MAKRRQDDEGEMARPPKMKGKPIPGHEARFKRLLNLAAEGEKEADRTSTPESGER